MSAKPLGGKRSTRRYQINFLVRPVGIRLKLFLLFFALGFMPMLALNFFNYLYGVRTAETMLTADVERDTTAIVRNLGAALRERENELAALARSSALRDYVRAGANRQKTSSQGDAAGSASAAATPQVSSAQAQPSPTGAAMPEEVATQMKAFFLGHQKYYATITCLNQTGDALFRLEPTTRGAEVIELSNLRFQTADFLSGVAMPDVRVWKTADAAPLRSTVGQESYGATMRYTVPVFLEEASGGAARGALVVDLNLDRVLKETTKDIAGIATSSTASSALSPAQVVLLDRSGRIVYHTNSAFKFQAVANVMPAFKPVAKEMTERSDGKAYYRAGDGDEWLAVFQRLDPLDLSLATSRNYSAAVGDLRRAGWLSLALAALVGLATALVLTRVVRRTARSIERVTEGAVAIAAGNLNQRIDVRSSDETHLLAESFNRMTDRLREQIAREAETRQFESFLRLSAMLTHDLKNAIASLSLLVRNMEHQFHREEFRADAMRSLTEATDKLRGLVSKLSEPVRSMSGEHGLPRPTDLVVMIRRVLEATGGPYSTHHKIETNLPESLVATVDAERMEKVVENLVLNALEAMGSEEGSLTVEAGELAGEKVSFSIRDTGPGMSEDFQRKQLFRPFATTKRKGVGLGLYTCREVVRAHGGEIEVESRKGVGTCFRVVLPSKQITDREGKTSRTSSRR